MSTRGPRGRFLALEPVQAGFKQLEIAVTNVFVAMFSGSLRVSPNVRMNRVMRPKMGLIGADSMPLSILAQASWRANRRKRPRVVTRGKIRCHSGLRARLPRREATEADRGHSRQDAVPWQHAGVLALERNCRPRKGVAP